MTPEETKTFAVNAIEDLKGVDVVSLDVRSMTGMTDYMVIASGTSNRHVKSMADNLITQAKKQGLQPLGVEGEATAEWVLVDFGDVVVHIQQPDTRQFYDLEGLWQPLEDS